MISYEILQQEMEVAEGSAPTMSVPRKGDKQPGKGSQLLVTSPCKDTMSLPTMLEYDTATDQ